MRRAAVLVVPLLAAATLAACTSEEVDPARAGTVVVSADLPFASLNAATAAGRAPGSVLVRGLVQSGFTALQPDGTVRADESFGTVEKVADDPLTVRYTIAPTARWSDGVPVTSADLLLEWAARSGQLDEVVPELDADGVVAGTPDGVVAFGAPSAALARATAVPRVDGATLTLVYDEPAADWQVALDVNLPAHVVGRLALDPTAPPLPTPGPTSTPTASRPTSSATPTAPGPSVAPGPSSTPTPTGTASPGPTATPTPTGTASPGPTATPSAGAAEVDWAQAVTDAVQEQDRDALAKVARVWRTAGRAADVAADPTLTTTTGPYVLARVDASGVEMVRNVRYEGDAPAAHDRVRLRTDLDPLAQVAAVAAGEVDVAAPLSTPDVLAAAEGAEDVALRTGGDAVLQLVLQESAGGVFDPVTQATADDPGEAAAQLRRAFLASVPRERVVSATARPLWARAAVSGAVAAQVAPDGGTTADAPAGTAPTSEGPRTVRVLTRTADPLRAAVLAVLAEGAADVGLDVVPVEVDDPAQALRVRPEDWDAALVPVAQEDLPVAAFVARWRSGGATNVTGHADPALDKVLDALVAEPDADEAADGLTRAADALVEGGAVLPLVRTPALTLVAAPDPQGQRPDVGDVPVLTPSAADLTWWWNWTRR